MVYDSHWKSTMSDEAPPRDNAPQEAGTSAEDYAAAERAEIADNNTGGTVPPGSKPEHYRTPLQPIHFLIVAFIVSVFGYAGSGMKKGNREVGVRAQNSRVRNDQRVLATGLESYYVESNSYPASRPLAEAAGLVRLDLQSAVARRLKELGRDDLHAVQTSGTSLELSSGTVILQNALYTDPFAPQWGTPMVYYSDGPAWVLVSAGPDQDYDMVPARDYVSSVTQPSARLLQLAYDPTNGTVSDGDIWRVKQ
ncbi:MAG: hypothetical protein ACR2IE_20370 [Candidatus Sumerlaeaceae bacterium]